MRDAFQLKIITSFLLLGEQKRSSKVCILLPLKQICKTPPKSKSNNCENIHKPKNSLKILQLAYLFDKRRFAWDISLQVQACDIIRENEFLTSLFYLAFCLDNKYFLHKYSTNKKGELCGVTKQNVCLDVICWTALFQ